MGTALQAVTETCRHLKGRYTTTPGYFSDGHIITSYLAAETTDLSNETAFASFQLTVFASFLH